MIRQRLARWTKVAIPGIIMAGVLMGGPSLLAAEIPEGLKGILISGKGAVIEQANLNGIPFNTVSWFSSLPYLMWPADANRPAPLDRDPAAVAAWLTGAADELGYAGFEPKFIERFTWRNNEVWRYRLMRRGVPLHDGRVMVHWNGARLVGIVNDVPGIIETVEDPGPAVAGEERVYYPVRIADGRFRLISAEVQRVERADRVEVSIMGPDGILEKTVHPERITPTMGEEPTFTEYRIPSGTFPDQISVAEDGIVWLSQPLNESFTSFDPVTEVFTQHPNPGASGPDGLIVGTKGRVWSGMFFSGGLGLYDTTTETFHNYPAPYPNAQMAIPVETSDGHVWVTDHGANRISEFDPASGTWIQSVVMPRDNSWVVQGHEDTGRGEVYFTENIANQLGRIRLGGNEVTDIPVPGGGPAFLVYSDGFVYYSRWFEAGIGAYDVQTGFITEYEVPVSNESGGPLWLTPDGDIVTGTRNRGYIMIFYTDTKSFSAHQIPTRSPGLKDGMTVGADGIIWFTETGANKLAKLEFPVEGGCTREPAWQCDGDVDGDGQVNPVDSGLVQAAFCSTVRCTPEALCQFDMDCDMQINPVDAGIVQALFGTCEAVRGVCP